MSDTVAVINQILGIVVQMLFTGVGLWIGVKITKNKVDFVGTLLIACVSVLAGMQPEPWGLSFCLASMFLLLWKFGGAKVFPDCVFTVLISWGIGFGGKFLIKYVAEHIK